MLTILNSISSLNAENALSSTQANLQKSLTQLSTGLKINSGSDAAAGTGDQGPSSGGRHLARPGGAPNSTATRPCASSLAAALMRNS